jgi:hypothetical protein
MKEMLCAGLLLASSSCVRVGWSHSQVHRMIPPAEHGALVVGESDLGTCLDALGAPLYVWEASQQQMVLVWGWGEEQGWGVNVSIPLAQEFSATIDYEDTTRDLQGLVLTFDSARVLLNKRLGSLADLPEGAAPDWISAVQEG